MGLAGKAGLLEIARPVEARRGAGEIGDRPPVVGRLLVAILDAGPVRLGEPALEGEHGGGALGAVLLAGEGQQLGEIGLVGGALLDLTGIVAQIIIAVGQAEARLGQAGDHLIGVALVAVHIAVERRG